VVRVIGTHNTAICYTNDLEPAAYDQIKALCDCEDFADSKIRIMPDVHAGMGCTIGTTMTISDKVVPGIVGVDIGCGMETVKLAQKNINFAALDELIRSKIPYGREVRDTLHPLNEKINLEELRCVNNVDIERARRSIGTLGGGNHFIEAGRADGGGLYLVIHSGSRHIGTEVAGFYQNEAYKTLCGNIGYNGINTIPKDLAYVSGELFDNYIHDMKIIQRFAALNRQAMADVILRGMGLTETDRFTTVHNYIDTDTMILRKGAVSAKAGERLLIPINMRDGSLICEGKGNEDWNFSAPHGAGRLMSRTAAFKALSMDAYIADMKGIFTTSVNRKTLDESPEAYKNINEIIRQIGPAVEIVERMRPVYNFKASE
jgi:RNA-splicing ligase RtcB